MSGSDTNRFGPKGRLGFSAFALAWLLILLSHFATSAATMTATLDRDTVLAGESATLTLRFDGGDPDSLPLINAGPNLRVANQGTSRSVSIDNGRVSSTITQTYSITPLQPGVYQIPSLQAKVQGQAVSTPPLKLTALKPGEQSQATEPQLAFMRLFVPLKQAFIGQAIQVELQVFVQDGVLNAEEILRAFDAYNATPITAEGCRILRTAHANRRRGQSGAATYTIATLVTAITPAKAGKLTIESIKVPLTLQLPVPGQRRRGVWDPFGMFQASQPREVLLVAPAEAIEVSSLPTQNVPSGFNGAIGSFSLSVEAGPTNVGVGDPITVRMRIEGRGNLEGLSLPQQPEWGSFKVYPATDKTETTDPLGLQGTKIFEQVVVPQSDQIQALPGIAFSFFDPEKKVYQTLTNPAVPLVVRPGGVTPTPSAMLPRGTAAEESPPAPDIIPIKRKIGSAKGPGEPLIRRGWFLALQAFPAAILACAITWRKRQDKLASNPRLRRKREVERKVRSGVVELRQLAAANNSDGFFLTVFRLLQEQIGERLNVPATSITESVVEDRLRPGGVSDDALNSTLDLFQKCNQARYAPARSTEQLEAMIPEVEKVLRKLQALRL